MRQHKNPKIDIACAYCEHAVRLQSEEGEEVYICKGKKTVSPENRCRRFRYDIRKRMPSGIGARITLDPETLVLD